MPMSFRARLGQHSVEGQSRCSRDAPVLMTPDRPYGSQDTSYLPAFVAPCDADGDFDA
jgi:hypothetical protein